MSSDAWGPGAAGPPGYPGYAGPPGYSGYAGPPGYPGYGGQPSYPPPYGYPAPGYPPPSGYPTYPGYPPPAGFRPAPKPGVIPLRPLSLSEILNASVTYVRTNPKAALGLTVIVVIVAQLVSLLIQVGTSTDSGVLSPGSDAAGEPMSESALVSLLLTSLAVVVPTVLAGIVLSGLLTVVMGRAVFGAKITIGESWQRIRGRLLALLAITAIEALGAAILMAVAIGAVVMADEVAGTAAAIVVGGLIILSVMALLTYLYTMLTFAPTLIVLERLGVMQSISRSFTLVRGGSWRVLGIRLLAVIVAVLISTAVSAPFSVVGQILSTIGESSVLAVFAVILISVGGAIGQIITAPFDAGVVVLLYADRRMRAEAFDLVLQTGAVGPAASTDDLWLTTQR